MEVLALVALLLAPLPQAAGQEGTVTGTLTFDGVSAPVAHVYASAQPGFFDKTTDDIHVLLSDVALSDEARTDVFALSKLARENGAHIVEVVIDAGGSPIGGSLFAKNFDSVMVSAAGMHKFTKERLERTVISGRLAVVEPKTFMGVTYEYDARFTAPIPRARTPDELAAALASPPARAAGAYVVAVHEVQLAGFVATLAASAAADYRGPDALAKLKDLSADMPADSKVVGLAPQTDGTVLATVEGHRDDGMVIGYTLKMALDAGAWKVAK